MQAFGCKTKPCRFVTTPGNKYPIMLGLCPPAKSVATKPMANPTSTLCRASLLIDFLNWVDLVEASPEEKHEDVDQRALHRLVESDPTIAADAYRRMCLATGGEPGAVSYICGRTPSTAWDQVRPTGGVVLASVVGVQVMCYQDLIVVEGGPHPSAALRGNKVITERFQRAMRVLRACLDLDPDRRVAATPAEWATHVAKSLVEADRAAETTRATVFKLLPNLPRSWGSPVPWHAEAVITTNITEFIARWGTAAATHIVGAMGSHLAVPDLYKGFARYSAFTGITTPAQWKRVTKDSLVAALTSNPDGFLDGLARYSAFTGITTPARWKTVTKNSLVAALTSNAAGLVDGMTKFAKFTGIAGPDQWTKCSGNSIYSAFSNDVPTLMAGLRGYSAFTGISTPDQWATMTCDGLISALMEDAKGFIEIGLTSFQALTGITSPRNVGDGHIRQSLFVSLGRCPGHHQVPRACQGNRWVIHTTTLVHVC